MHDDDIYGPVHQDYLHEFKTEADFDPFDVEIDIAARVERRFKGLTAHERDVIRKAGQERLEDPDALTGTVYGDNVHPLVEDPMRQLARMGRATRTRQREARQTEFCRLIALGYSRTEAAHLMGISVQTYYNWRSPQEFPDSYEAFRANMRQAEKMAQERFSDLGDHYSSNIKRLPFEALRKICFGRETYSFQRVMIDIIENAPEGEITMILLPPGVGKTLTVEDYLAIEIGKDHTKRVIYISESDDLPEKVAYGLKQRMIGTDPEYARYQEAFGPFQNPDDKRATIFRTDRMRVLGASSDNRDYTLQAKGWNSQIYSMRGDIIILDDVQTANTLKQTKTMLSKLRTTVLSRREGGIKGKVIYIGTRLDLNDLPGEMIKQGMVKPECLFVLPLVNTQGLSNFEEVIPTRSLPTLVRQFGSDFQSVYQQNPKAKKGVTFGEVIDNVKDTSRSIVTNNSFISSIADDICGRITSVDPALDGGNAVMSLVWTLDMIYVTSMDYEFDLQRISRIEDKIEWEVLQNNSDLVIVEAAAFQKGLATSERLTRMASSYGFTIQPHETKRNKNDPVIGVAKMESTFGNGGVSVPWADKASQAMFDQFIQQIKTWRPDVPTKVLVQDCLMAFWFAWVRITTERRNLAIQQQQEKEVAKAREHRGGRRRSGLPFAKTTYSRRRRR